VHRTSTQISSGRDIFVQRSLLRKHYAEARKSASCASRTQVLASTRFSAAVHQGRLATGCMCSYSFAKGRDKCRARVPDTSRLTLRAPSGHARIARASPGGAGLRAHNTQGRSTRHQKRVCSRTVPVHTVFKRAASSTGLSAGPPPARSRSHGNDIAHPSDRWTRRSQGEPDMLPSCCPVSLETCCDV
jgi:hypothetical protein